MHDASLESDQTMSPQKSAFASNHRSRAIAIIHYPDHAASCIAIGLSESHDTYLA